jgi:hypothetical protein
LSDVVVTGLLLVSTSGGAERNAASIDEGFNPNDIREIRFIGEPA